MHRAAGATVPVFSLDPVLLRLRRALLDHVSNHDHISVVTTLLAHKLQPA